MTEDINKLPKWAQNRINAAEWRLKELSKLTDREIPTKVRVSKLHTDIPTYIPDDRGLVFTLPTGDIEVRIKEDGLEVYAHDKRLSILPQVTNVVMIKLEGI